MSDPGKKTHRKMRMKSKFNQLLLHNLTLKKLSFSHTGENHHVYTLGHSNECQCPNGRTPHSPDCDFRHLVDPHAPSQRR